MCASHRGNVNEDDGPLVSFDEVDLLSFFEVDPRVAGNNMAWDLNNSVYETGDGQRDISFRITPRSKDVSIVLKSGDAVVSELHAAYVNDVRYHKEKGRESLEIVISSEDSI